MSIGIIGGLTRKSMKLKPLPSAADKTIRLAGVQFRRSAAATSDAPARM